MNLEWIDDLLVLMEEQNFSKAAQRRHISQPAFSRRIQSLEQWIGAELIDRTTKPIGLMIDENILKLDFQSLRDQIFELRAKIRAASHDRTFIRLAAQQALTITVFPSLNRAIKGSVDNASFRLRSANQHDCVAMFLRGSVDILLCYETHQHTVDIPSAFAEKTVLFEEHLVPVAKSNSPYLQEIRTNTQQQLPLLLYPPESFLGQVVKDFGVREILHLYDLDVICESAFSSGLKEMAVEGMGIAWLPHQLVATELGNDSLTDLSKWLNYIRLDVSLFWANRSLSGLSADILHTIRKGFDSSPRFSRAIAEE